MTESWLSVCVRVPHMCATQKRKPWFIHSSAGIYCVSSILENARYHRITSKTHSDRKERTIYHCKWGGLILELTLFMCACALYVCAALNSSYVIICIWIIPKCFAACQQRLSWCLTSETNFYLWMLPYFIHRNQCFFVKCALHTVHTWASKQEAHWVIQLRKTPWIRSSKIHFDR